MFTVASWLQYRLVISVVCLCHLSSNYAVFLSSVSYLVKGLFLIDEKTHVYSRLLPSALQLLFLSTFTWWKLFPVPFPWTKPHCSSAISGIHFCFILFRITFNMTFMIWLISYIQKTHPENWDTQQLSSQILNLVDWRWLFELRYANPINLLNKLQSAAPGFLGMAIKIDLYISSGIYPVLYIVLANLTIFFIPKSPLANIISIFSLHH